ncbi:MAG: serine/threonine-protein kinase [Planctomycetota bacterium]|jgi:serine/threonine-protein kinase
MADSQLPSPEKSRSPLHAVFCPQKGAVGNSSDQFVAAQHELANSRLRTAALILCVGSGAFLARNLVLGLYDTPMLQKMGWAHAGLVIVLAVVAGLLTKVHVGCRIRLLTIELLIFGLPTLLFVGLQHCRICDCHPEMRSEMVWAYPAETAVPWIILINLYALFVPNTPKRATAVVIGMALIPLFGAGLASLEEPLLRARMFGGGGLSALALWLSISSVTAVYGSHRLGKLRREAFDAKRLGSYTLKRKLGAGGMGEVHLAEHQLLKRPCAIKLIRPDKADETTAIARFETEVQATAGLTHPNTVEIYDYGYTEEGTFYYVMEYLPGRTLQEFVERGGAMPAARVIHLMRQVCSALTEAHNAGLIHRDIKPGNIFATERGGVLDVAKLLDFGLVKSTLDDESSPEITVEGAVIGSPLYAPPERVVGDVEPDVRGDVYSLGATAYYLLTGRPVFGGEKALKILFAHANETPQPLQNLNSDVPADLEAVVLRCLSKNPDDRFQTAADLAAALEACRDAGQWDQLAAHDAWSSSDDPSSTEDSVESFDLETQLVR